VAIVGTFVILSLVKLVVPLRVPEEDEINGLDVALHGEVAYNFGGSGAAAGAALLERA
jgi:Amt family ammonium transporter